MAKNNKKIESQVSKILKKDGIQIVEVDNVEIPTITSLSSLRKNYPKGKSWARRVVNTYNSSFFNSATVISQNKGEGCRRHKHPDCDEFWAILSGKYKVEIGERRKTRILSSGDILYLKKGTAHKLTVISYEPGVRLSVSVEAMKNIYYE